METGIYNKCFFYLCEKYGKRLISYTDSFNKSLQNKSKKVKLKLISEATDKDKIYTFFEPTKHDDKKLVEMMKSYNLVGSRKLLIESMESKLQECLTPNQQK